MADLVLAQFATQCTDGNCHETHSGADLIRAKQRGLHRYRRNLELCDERRYQTRRFASNWAIVFGLIRWLLEKWGCAVVPMAWLF